jgi:hypothetical protein
VGGRECKCRGSREEGKTEFERIKQMDWNFE